MLKNSYQNLIPESLCPKILIQMKEYDKAHNTQYSLLLNRNKSLNKHFAYSSFLF
jgi:hypothetical protein